MARHRVTNWMGLPELIDTLSAGDAYAGIGSRKTPAAVRQIMQRVAARLSGRGLVLRSGGAWGADQAFERGVPNGGAKQIFLPWEGFERNSSALFAPPEEAFDIAMRFHPRWDKLSARERAFMARNSQQVLGQSLDQPSKFVLCWTKDGKATGGTGQAIRVARGHDIPVFNLKLMGVD